MIRTLCFLVAVCCCIGLISGSYSAILDTGDEVTFTEEVLLGDPGVLDGRVAEFGVCYGRNLVWDFTYRFGAEDSHETEVLFSQQPFTEGVQDAQDVLSVYAHSGWGASSTGGMELGTNGYAAMISTVAAVTQKGEQREMNLKLADFVDFHALNYHVDYMTDQYICNEYVDQLSYMSGIDTTYDSPSYEAFSRLFRFPVQPDEIVTISVWVNEAGAVSDINYNALSDYMVSVVSCATDAGVYCVPVYRNDATGTAVPGEYAQGMGVYFIPWKAYDDGSVYAEGRQCVTLDVANAENVCPLPETTLPCGLSMDEAGDAVWLLSQEAGVYVLTQLDLRTNQVLDRFELMEKGQGGGTPKWYIQNDLMLVYANGKLALLTTDGTPALEFIAPTGEASDGLYYITTKTGALIYEDGLLYLADAPYFNSILNMMVFDENGPVYWGNYHCSLFDCNEMGGSQLRILHNPTGLE
jgi:hypothetical protein